MRGSDINEIGGKISACICIFFVFIFFLQSLADTRNI